MYINLETRQILASITVEQWEAIARLSRQMILNSEKVLKTGEIEEDCLTNREINNNIMQLFESIKLDEKVEIFLNNIGVPDHVKGYLYLKEAIIFIYENPNQPYCMYKISSEVAKKYETTTSKVNSAISNCLKMLFQKEPNEFLKRVYESYPSLKDNKSSKPAIAIFSDYIRQHM